MRGSECVSLLDLRGEGRGKKIEREKEGVSEAIIERGREKKMRSKNKLVKKKKRNNIETTS